MRWHAKGRWVRKCREQYVNLSACPRILRACMIEQLESRTLLDGLAGSYYPTMDLTGNPLVTRVDPSINFSWGSSAPATGMPADRFSVRWTGQVQATYSQTYTFYTVTDDGVRLWVNGIQLINQWNDHSPTEHKGTMALVAGQRYDIKMEYYENGWGATAQLLWSSAGQAKQVIPASALYSNAVVTPSWPENGNGVVAEYFDNLDLTASKLKRIDTQVNFSWGSGSPSSLVGPDTFSVRWTGAVQARYSEQYTFYTYSDDGVRLWVDNVLLVNNWTDHSPTENKGTIVMDAGQTYDIRMEYYERGWGATASLSWSSASQAKQIVPQSVLYSIPPAPAVSQTYYVAIDGSDSAAGSLAAPFRTIQHAADTARAGDTVLIREGTYRETVRPAHSGTSSRPITIQPYNNEDVTISGADVIGGWSNFQAAIYKTSMPWTLGTGNDQIFVDGQMMIEARWPNTTLDVSRPIKAYIDGGTSVTDSKGTTQTVTDSHLTAPAGFWNGGIINIIAGSGYIGASGTISSQSSGSITYRMINNGSVPQSGNAYYLTGKFQALDAPDEWFRDPSTGQIFLWTPDSADPGTHLVEAKRRNYAIDLRARSNIIFKNIAVFGATIVSDSATSDTVLDGIDAKYVSHYSVVDQRWDTHMNDTGIILNGARNTLKNSTIAYSAGNGVTLLGSDSFVTNNIIRDVDYAATDNAAINTGSSGQLSTRQEISHNTVFNSGRGLIVHRNLTASRIVYNDIFRGGLQTTDFGGTYAYAVDGAGTEIAYNRIHDMNAGIYLDGEFTKNFIIHHNVIWNATSALVLNCVSTNNLIYNNTLVGTLFSVSGTAGNIGRRELTNTRMINNIFTATVNTTVTSPSAAAVEQNNLYRPTDPVFVDAVSRDYRIQSTSPATDTGQVLAGYTDGYSGVAPDIGASEGQGSAWPSGSTLSAEEDPGTVPIRSAFIPIEAVYYDDPFGVVIYARAIGNFDDKDWIRFNQVDFGSGASRFTAWLGVPDLYAGQRIDLRLDSVNGPLIGTLAVASTGSFNVMAAQNTAVSGAAGIHDLYLVGRGGSGICNLDAFVFAN